MYMYMYMYICITCMYIEESAEHHYLTVTTHTGSSSIVCRQNLLCKIQKEKKRGKNNNMGILINGVGTHISIRLRVDLSMWWPVTCQGLYTLVCNYMYLYLIISYMCMHTHYWLFLCLPSCSLYVCYTALSPVLSAGS